MPISSGNSPVNITAPQATCKEYADFREGGISVLCIIITVSDQITSVLLQIALANAQITDFYYKTYRFLF